MKPQAVQLKLIAGLLDRWLRWRRLAAVSDGTFEKRLNARPETGKDWFREVMRVEGNSNKHDSL